MEVSWLAIPHRVIEPDRLFMPTYEYLCRQCGDSLEVWQSFKDAALTRCESCGGSLRKVFHARGVVFKGSGFYVTDSRKPNPASAGTNGKSSAEQKSQKSGGSSSESGSTTDKSSAGASKSQTSSSE